MIVYNKAAVGRAAKEKGFPRDTFEKVLRLKEVLAFINSDDFLRKHLVLKGGTAGCKRKDNRNNKGIYATGRIFLIAVIKIQLQSGCLLFSVCKCWRK